jgi:hypothetical protein
MLAARVDRLRSRGDLAIGRFEGLDQLELGDAGESPLF